MRVGYSKSKDDVNMPELKHECLEKLEGRYSWLKDEKFVRDIESDSVDSDILDEELNTLQEEDYLTRRQKVSKCLQSNPVQILLCVVVLLDAGIVIAQILLDLHSVREELHMREDQLEHLIQHLRDNHPEDLGEYAGGNIKVILELLDDHSVKNNHTEHLEQPRHRTVNVTNGNIRHQNHRVKKLEDPSTTKATDQNTHYRVNAERDDDDATYVEVASESDENGSHNHADIDNIHIDVHSNNVNGIHLVSDVNCNNSSSNCDRTNTSISNYTYASSSPTHSDVHQAEHDVLHDEHNILHEIAHGFHYASLAILGFLVLEDLVKMIAMGKEFFRHKLEIVDFVIIVASFLFDFVILNGFFGEEGEKAAAVLIALLLWRIARVVDGIIITAKQRQEFRIRLQKRARRKAEQRIDTMIEEKHSHINQIKALKAMCVNAGVTEDDVDSVTPKPGFRPSHGRVHSFAEAGKRRVSNTMCALSSVARMSVSMTMSMSSGLFGMISGRSNSYNKGASSESSDRVNRNDSGATLNTHSTPIRRHSASALGIPGGGSSSNTSNGDGGGASSSSRTKTSGGLMHSVSAPATSTENMKDDQMNDLATTVINMSASPRNLRRLSPCNNTGITIVIDTGSLSADEDSCSSSSDSEEVAAKDPLLSNNIKSNNKPVGNGDSHSEAVDQTTPLQDRRVSHVSQNSQVHLLS